MLYTLSPHKDVALALALAGGRGDDVVVTLNPVAGRGLTHLVRLGSALHQACRGAGAGLSWRAPRDATLAAAVMHDGAPARSSLCFRRKHRLDIFVQFAVFQGFVGEIFVYLGF